MVKIKRALISVSDKSGIVRFGQGLRELGVEILSTGGTASMLRDNGVEVTDVSEATGFPEMLDGRVKTLHPNIHGALLARRDKPEHMAAIKEHGIEPIDLVVVNLYPFAATVEKEGVTEEEIIENIDIGGPSMIRSAAKNFASVAVVVSPSEYGGVLKEMQDSGGGVSLATRRYLAQAAFEQTADYDEGIFEYFEGEEPAPPLLKLVFEKIQDLRYGENPHQKAAYYRDELADSHSLVHAQQLHGTELSFNNILDLDAAWKIAGEFNEPTAVIIKHSNPCGTATTSDLTTAFNKAWAADSLSAFGSVVALNGIVTKETAAPMAEKYIEAVIADEFTEEALAILTQKPKIRLLAMGSRRPAKVSRDIRRVDGGILVQDADAGTEERAEMELAGSAAPSEDQWRDLVFAWKVAKHVKSNAIVIAKDSVTVGVGAGQMSRVDATELAIKKAGAENCAGCVMASDAFFPFRDAVDAAAAVGIKAIIQPGGSIRDDEVNKAAEEHGIAMVLTGKRHFRH